MRGCAAPRPRVMALDLDERLQRSNARFQASILGIVERYNYPFEDDFLISMETLTYDTPDGPKQWGDLSVKKLRKLFKHHVGSQRTADQTADEESDADVVSVRRRFEDIHFQNLDVDDVKMQEKVQVQVDVIVQDNGRRIPKWITVAPSSSQLASPVREPIGNQSSVCRKKLELANKRSSSPHQLQFSGPPMSPNTITVPRHECFQEMNETCYNSTLEEYQSADEGCSWSNITLADLYPKMVEVLTKLITREARKKTFKYMFGYCRHKRWHARRPKLSITAEKIRRFRPLKLKKELPSICSSSKDIQNQTFRNNVYENSGPCDDLCSINNASGLVPFSYSDTSEMEMDCSDSSLGHHLVFGEDQKVSEQTAIPNALAKMGETFLVEDQLQTTVSLNSSKYNKSGNLTYKHSLESPFRTSSAPSGSVVLHMVKESKIQKNDFPSDDTSGFCSSTCSVGSDSNTFTPIKNYYLASGTSLMNPDIKISERQNSFQRRHSFSSLSVKQSPSKTPQKYEDAFEKLYYKLCSKGIQKPLMLTKPLSNSQKLEEKGGIMKNTFSDSRRSNIQYNTAFEKIYQQLSSEMVPKLPGFQRASNLRKYEGIQMSETVNALVNSPVRSFFGIPRVKRLGNFQNDLLSSPVKRLKNIPEHFFSTKRQQISHKKYGDLQTVGMDFVSPRNGSNTRFFNSHNCHHQDSGFHASSDKTYLVIPDASLKESEITDAHSSWPRTMPNYSSPGNTLKCPQKVSRKLSYTNGKDRNPSSPLDNVLIKTHQGAFMAYRENDIVL
ncbi:Holliday junction recognition protein [Numida meleagris]|uniref:Holliday junction recognition protein n=1 Tax=Numida meleagris TaxID=8996 RepID=UPI000B3E283F|nr:Holliday junction recognition protein [Numida meleagris]